MSQNPNNPHSPTTQGERIDDISSATQRDGTAKPNNGGRDNNGERVGNDDLGDPAASPNNIAG